MTSPFRVDSWTPAHVSDLVLSAGACEGSDESSPGFSTTPGVISGGGSCAVTALRTHVLGAQLFEVYV
jgi:hypothetical protein